MGNLFFDDSLGIILPSNLDSPNTNIDIVSLQFLQVTRAPLSGIFDSSMR
jgi:hypothetical protein